MSMHLILKMPSSHYSLFLFRSATSRSAQQIQLSRFSSEQISDFWISSLPTEN